MMLRRDVLDKIGYFDEDFFMYGEELDLSWRINLAGNKIYCVPGSVIYHLGRGTAGRSEHRKMSEYLLHKNHFLVLFKNYSSKTLSSILPIKLLLEIIAFFAFLFVKPETSYAIYRTFLWLVANTKMLIKKHNDLKKIRRLSDEEIKKRMINHSVPILYYLGGKKYFKDYIRYMPYLNIKD